MKDFILAVTLAGLFIAAVIWALCAFSGRGDDDGR